MSKKRFGKRRVAVALTCGIMMLGLAPSAANAGYETIHRCVPLPVSTPGVTVLGQHVPALSNIEICAGADVWYEIYLPTIQNYDNCGTPCFAVKAYLRPAYASFRGANILVRWWEDGIEKYPGPSNPIVNPVQIPGDGQDPPSPQEVCLIAVGNPTPPCTL